MTPGSGITPISKLNPLIDAALAPKPVHARVDVWRSRFALLHRRQSLDIDGDGIAVIPVKILQRVRELSPGLSGRGQTLPAIYLCPRGASWPRGSCIALP